MSDGAKGALAASRDGSLRCAAVCLLFALSSALGCGASQHPTPDAGNAAAAEHAVRDADPAGEDDDDAGQEEPAGDDAGTRMSPASDGGAPRDSGRPMDAGAVKDAAVVKGPEAGAPSTDAGQGKPSWLIKSGDSVFFVGNSFFGFEDRKLPDWVAAVGRVSKPAIEIKTGSHVVFGNNPLSWFFQQTESKRAIKSGTYSVFVLQAEEREPVEDKQGFQQAVRDYYNAISASGGRVMLFMTWDFAWEADTTFFRDLAASYEEIGRELHIPVIPVGLIYDDCNKAPYGNEMPYWLTGQDLHQLASGSAVNAYATFGMLTGINPDGVVFQANGNDNSPDLLRYLSDKSWARVSERLAHPP